MFRVSRVTILAGFLLFLGGSVGAKAQIPSNCIDIDVCVIIKKEISAGSQSEKFDFQVTTNNLAPNSFKLSNNEEISFGISASGIYNIKEVLQAAQVTAGWKLKSVNCQISDNSDDLDWSPIESGVSIQVGQIQNEGFGEITCTFDNEFEEEEPDGSLVIVKNTIGADGSFGFTVSGPQNSGGTINTSNNTGKLTFSNLTTTGGAYTITESSLPGSWSLAAISCDSGNPGPADLSSRSITVNVQPNQTTTCTFTNKLTDDPTLRDVVSLFINSRLNNLLSNDPDRNRLQRRLNPVQNNAGFAPLSVTGKADNENRDLKFSVSSRQLRQSALADQARKINEANKLRSESSKLGLIENTYSDLAIVENRFDIWAEGHLNRYTNDGGGYRRKGDFNILYFGADYALTPDVLLGALIQFDWTDENIQGFNSGFGKAKGNGWMAGPYIDIRLTDNIFFNGRAAWGKSDNDIAYSDSILGARFGQFDSNRWLITGELTGAWIYNGLHIRPSVQLAYGSEDQEAFASSNGVIVGSTDASVGRVTFGPEFSYKRQLQDGTILEPLFAVEGIWNFHGNDTILTNGFIAGNDDFRVDVEGGLIVHMTNGVNFRLIGDYDGIGDSGFDSYGGQAWLNIPLN